MAQENMYDWAREGGFKHHTARALNLLAGYLNGEHEFEKNPKVFRKLKSLNIVDEDGNVQFDEDPEDGAEWVLFGLAYEGMVTRSFEDEET